VGKGDARSRKLSGVRRGRTKEKGKMHREKGGERELMISSGYKQANIHIDTSRQIENAIKRLSIAGIR
jgi:hypothetical protein